MLSQHTKPSCATLLSDTWTAKLCPSIITSVTGADTEERTALVLVIKNKEPMSGCLSMFFDETPLLHALHCLLKSHRCAHTHAHAEALADTCMHIHTDAVAQKKS